MTVRVETMTPKHKFFDSYDEAVKWLSDGRWKPATEWEHKSQRWQRGHHESFSWAHMTQNKGYDGVHVEFHNAESNSV